LSTLAAADAVTLIIEIVDFPVFASSATALPLSSSPLYP
jgi:hypothetical protein